jgi:hypothetical protein
MDAQILREKLLYAIHHCSAIDADFTDRGTVLLDNEVDDSELEYIVDTDVVGEDESLQASEMPLNTEPTGGLFVVYCIVCMYACMHAF